MADKERFPSGIKELADYVSLCVQIWFSFHLFYNFMIGWVVIASTKHIQKSKEH